VRVFVSSVIKDFEPFREAARGALEAFASDRYIDLSIFMSEVHHATAASPIRVCRDEVAQADVVVGIYGSDYGFVDIETGKSVTQLEAEWAMDEFHRPLLAFLVEEDVEDSRQRELRDRVGDFRLGVWFSAVRTPNELRFELYRALGGSFPVIAWQSELLALGQRIHDDDLHHLSMPLRAAETLEASQLLTTVGDPALVESVMSALVDGTDAVFVLGEVGCGKTWFLKQMFCDALDAYRADNNNPVPCLVDLGAAVLDIHHASWPWDWKALLEPAGERALLLLDAYDEAVAKSPPGSRLKLLESLLSVTSPGRQLVISSRSHLFETSERLSRLIETAGYGSIGPSRRGGRLSHATVFVKALAEEDIRVFLRDEYGDVDGDLWERMKSVIDLPDLAKRPVLLPMVCDSLGDLEDIPHGERVTAGHLYRTYTERWLSRDAWRLGLGPEPARRFFEELALHFHNNGSDSMLFDEFPNVFPSFFPTARLSAERDRLTDALRSASFLSNSSTGQYGFVHRSFLEYFLAERLVYAIVHSEQDLALARFPSKVTDEFVIDLLRREADWAPGLLSLIRCAKSPIARYLCAYLADRATRDHGLISREGLAAVLGEALETEENPFVVRELLVSLTDLGCRVDDAALVRHLDRPVPIDVIELELKDYYGSLEEARRYLRARLNPPSDAQLRLFYLISIAAISTPDDRTLLEHYNTAGDANESRIAQQALQALADRSLDAERDAGSSLD
jgi:Domain of unknown function (DUF4062)/NACHT domain